MKLSDLSIKLFKLGLVSKLYINRSLYKIGLYSGQTQILHYISENPYCTQIQLSKSLNVSPASIALSTKKMERNKLIKKTVEDDNLRCKHLELTELGVEALNKCNNIFDSSYNLMYRDFTQEEIDLFSSFIDRITMNLTEETDNPIDGTTVSDLMKEVDAMEHGKL